jgi:hypothetical protein
MLNEPFCKECYFRSSCDGIVGGPQCATNASGTQPTDVQQLKPKMPRVEDIINDVVGTQISMHDQAVVAGINECYRYISRHFGH